LEYQASSTSTPGKKITKPWNGDCESFVVYRQKAFNETVTDDSCQPLFHNYYCDGCFQEDRTEETPFYPAGNNTCPHNPDSIPWTPWNEAWATVTFLILINIGFFLLSWALHKYKLGDTKPY
jgi:hypothetical protein